MGDQRRCEVGMADHDGIGRLLNRRHIDGVATHLLNLTLESFKTRHTRRELGEFVNAVHNKQQ